MKRAESENLPLSGLPGDRIIIRNLEVFCNHGVYKEENVLGQKFLVDVDLFVDTRKAAVTDDIAYSVNYGEVCRLLEREMKSTNDKLIERVAQRLCLSLLLTFPLIHAVRLEIKKPWAPVMRHLDYASCRIHRGWHRVFVGAGSNLGDREGLIYDAAKKIAALDISGDSKYKLTDGMTGPVRNFRMAPVIETKAWGVEDQPDYLNTVFELETIFSPEELLERLFEIEKKAGRIRKEHWGPRTLDLDLLLYDDMISQDSDLVLPHPLLHKRRFVLEPLCQLYPNGIHPLYRKRFRDFLEEL